jgi:putative ABC transport system permease protein
MLLIFSLLALLLGAMLTATVIGGLLAQHVRQIAIMKAIGARSAAMIRSVLGEGVLIALLSWIVALVLSLPLSAQVGGVLASISTQELSLQLSPFGAGLWLCVVLLGSVVVSFYPAKRASQLTVRQTLAYT